MIITKIKNMIKRIFLLVLLIPMLQSCSCGTDNGYVYYSDYRDACKNGDFEQAHERLDELYDNFIQVRNENEVDRRPKSRWKRMSSNYDERLSNIKTAATEYCAAARYIYTTEAKVLIKENSEDAVEPIVSFFSEFQMIGEVAPDGFDWYDYKPMERECYIEYVKAVNAIADAILDLAIQYKDEKIANIAFDHYMDVPVETKEGEGFRYTYVVRYSSASKNRAEGKWARANGYEYKYEDEYEDQYQDDYEDE
jgi:hypothetical protein